MSAHAETSLEDAINLIQRRFLKKAYEARSDESVTVAFEIRRCLAVISESDRLKRAYELLESALWRWQEGFARVVVESFRELCSLAFAHPEWVRADPIKWAHAQTGALIAAELDGKLCRDVQWRAEEEAAANPVAPVTDRPRPARHLEWYMRAIEGSDFIPPLDSAGQTEVWLAPLWVTGRPIMGRPWSDERMTVTQTNTVLRLARSGFEHRSQYVLDDAVEKARIDLVCRPLSSSGMGRASIIDKLRMECGWSFDELAKQTGIDKKLAIGHAHGKGIRPVNLKVYAQAFSKALKREVTVHELESQPT